MRVTQNIFAYSDLVSFVGTFLLTGLITYNLSLAIINPLFESKKSLDIYIKNTLHELNVPISTINANVKLLEKNLGDEKDIKRLTRIKGASKNLQELYEDLEYMLKKESGSEVIEEFEISEFLQDIIVRFEDIKKDIKLTLEASSQNIRCDKRGFGKTMENLISNAIKFNKKDGIVQISYKNNILCVEDSGKGMENRNLFSIFERYYKEDNNSFGHGIGLSIVKEFCDKSKVEIKITSKKDIGTKICLNLRPLTLS